MQILDNISSLWGDDLKQGLKPGAYSGPRKLDHLLS